jgi:hypothetical protein
MGRSRFVRAILPLAFLPATIAVASAANLVPWPRSVSESPGSLTLEAGSMIVAGGPALRPLAEVLAGEIHAATGLRLAVGRTVDLRRPVGDHGPP